MVGQEGAGLGTRDGDDAERDTCVHQGHVQHAAETMQPRDSPKCPGCPFFCIRNDERLAVPSELESLESIDLSGEIGLERVVGGRIYRRERGEMDSLVHDAEDGSRPPAKQPFGAGGNRLEDRRGVRGRACDHLQNV
jgi:hypothetical protein